MVGSHVNIKILFKTTMTHAELMGEAILEAEISIREGNAPFAVIVTNAMGEIVWRDHDRVKELMDPTAHGEINAVRSLCKNLQTLSLYGYVFYTTSEPCPTCFSAMVKARVATCYFGARTESTASLPIPVAVLASYAKKYPIQITGGILEAECLKQRENYFQTQSESPISFKCH